MNTCTQCGDPMDNPHTIITEGKVWICESCLLETYCWCEKCGRYGDDEIRNVEFWKTGVDGHFCEDCIKLLQKEYHCKAKNMD